MNRLAKEARDAARDTGALPHELLLQWARGEPMSRRVPVKGSNMKDPSTWELQYEPVEADAMRDAAKAAAPYYAPKITAVEVVMGVSDADLDEFITRSAAEAGFSIGHGGEGQEDPRTED